MWSKAGETRPFLRKTVAHLEKIDIISKLAAQRCNQQNKVLDGSKDMDLKKPQQHGGARQGAGAKPKGLVRQVSIKVTDEEYRALQKVNKSRFLRDAIKPLLSQQED